MTADPIAAVRADMSEFSAVFDSWSQKLTLDMTTQHAAHKQTMSEATEEIAALRQQQTALTKAHQTLKRGRTADSLPSSPLPPSLPADCCCCCWSALLRVR